MEELNFEQSLKELETIVSKLESGSISLEESIVLYQRGLDLYGSCYKKLQEAEQLIVKINEENKE
jgi:exodeoxyribonuclease VII small subunit